MTSKAAAIPRRALALLAAGVVLAHGVVVQQATRLLASGDPLGTRVFSTRIVQVRAADTTAVGAPPAPAGPRAPNIPAPKPRPVAAATDAALAPQIAQATLHNEAAPPPEPEAPAELVPATPPVPAASVAQASTDAASAAVSPLPPVPPVIAPAPNLPKDLAQPPRNYAVPGSVRLKFNANGMRGKLQYHASGELAWLHDGRRYEARLELGAFLVGSRVLSSTGQLTADGLAPSRFSDRFRSEQAAHFDRNRGRVTFSANTPEADLLAGAQDQLSVFVQLASMIAGDPARYPTGSTITLQTVGPRHAEPWPFVVEAQEKLALPGGTLDTLKLTRAPRRDYDQKVEIWLAPALSYLPSRIRITQTSGDFIDQQWRASADP